MDNKVYISFSAENSSSDAWATELMNSFQLTLSKISQTTISFSSNMNQSSAAPKNLENADLILLVFNGFVSDEFTTDLKVLEAKHVELISKGKEIYVIVKSGKFGSIIPVYIRKFTQYNFFEINTRTNESLEYTPLLKGEKENKFWSKLTDLAYDTKIYFENKLNLNQQNNSEYLTIYLAEVSKDQLTSREKLRREFLLSGHTVLPSKPLPSSFKEYQEGVRGLLNKSSISVHIMGEIYGDSPSGSDYSFQEIQNKLVSERIAADETNTQPNSFYRFVWLPPSLEPYDEKQIQYLKRIRKELSDSNTSEIVQCSIEEFKELFNQKIDKIGDTSKEIINSDDTGILLIVTDDANNANCHQIENKLKTKGIKYDLIDLSSTGEMMPLAMFRQKANLANQAIIINSNSDSFWIQGIVGLTTKNMNSKHQFISKSIALVSSSNFESIMDFKEMDIMYCPVEDKHFSNRLDEFLNQR